MGSTAVKANISAQGPQKLALAYPWCGNQN